MTDDDIVEGYMDGRDPDSPAPSANRSASYQHGFANGRDDLARKPRAHTQIIRKQGEEARKSDEAQSL